jgi:hypothetical protein
MALRVLLVLATLVAVLYGCGQASSPLENSETSTRLTTEGATSSMRPDWRAEALR